MVQWVLFNVYPVNSLYSSPTLQNVRTFKANCDALLGFYAEEFHL